MKKLPCHVLKHDCLTDTHTHTPTVCGPVLDIRVTLLHFKVKCVLISATETFMDWGQGFQ